MKIDNYAFVNIVAVYKVFTAIETISHLYANKHAFRILYGDGIDAWEIR